MKICTLFDPRLAVKTYNMWHLLFFFTTFHYGVGDKYEECVQKSEETHVEGDGIDPVGQLVLGVAGVVHVQRHGKDEKTKKHL